MASTSKVNVMEFLNTQPLKYIPFENLLPGRYAIKEFFHREFKKGEQLCINFEDTYYVILPKRFSSKDYPLEILNKTPKDFIFKGKKSTYVVDFSFESADPSKSVKVKVIGDNDDDE